jgi:hypothetical protein
MGSYSSIRDLPTPFLVLWAELVLAATVRDPSTLTHKAGTHPRLFHWIINELNRRNEEGII